MVSIDLFIVTEDLCNKGLGTQILTEVSDCVLRDADVDTVVIDPNPKNIGAIRCFEKAGFRNLAVYETPDGPSLFMVKY